MKKREQALAEMQKQEKERIFSKCACGHPFEANFADRCRKCGAKRLEVVADAKPADGEQHAADRSAPDVAAHHVATLVNSMVALRCGCTQEEVALGMIGWSAPLGGGRQGAARFRSDGRSEMGALGSDLHESWLCAGPILVIQWL